jgi:anthranilate phosphoribosyltransferase
MRGAALEALCQGKPLSRSESERVFSALVVGGLSELELTALLVALKAKGESPEEIAGAASAIRQAALPFDGSALELVDCCGTGGDGAGTVNISTAAAVVAAELGLHVAKHGNRSVSSRCGSADVLEASGIKIDAAPHVARRCLEELGIAFLLAPQYHAGMRYAAPVRQALGVRTIFNLIGPLVNPARPKVQLVGVYGPELCVPLAETLGLLGCRSALVVHGSGLDEITVHGATTAAQLLADGRVQELVLTPEAAGLERHTLEGLVGGDARHNARWLAELLAGKGTRAQVQAVALNAGALLWIADAAPSLADGVARAVACLDRGTALSRLQRWAELSHAA